MQTVQVELTKPGGDPVTTPADAVRAMSCFTIHALNAEGMLPQPIEPTAGVWNVELPNPTVDRLRREGFLDVQIGGYRMTARNP